MLKTLLPLFDLTRFDGAPASAGAAAPSDSGENSGTTGGTLANPSVAGKDKSGGSSAHILYGKQSAVDASPVAGEGEHINLSSNAKSADDRRKAYRALVEGEFKDLYTEDTQNIINRRFRQTEELREQNERSQSVLRILMGRYNIEDGDIDKLQKAIEDDDSYWASAADEAGMTVDQYKQLQKLKRQNSELLALQRQRLGAERAEQQTRQWYAEAQELKSKFPKFDLAQEVKNPQFLSMLRSGTPVEHAYKVLHFDELLGDAVSFSAAQQEQKIVANVRARGARPPENGTTAQSAFTVKDDVSKLSKKDRAEIARRAQRGEIISF